MTTTLVPGYHRRQVNVSVSLGLNVVWKFRKDEMEYLVSGVDYFRFHQFEMHFEIYIVPYQSMGYN